MKVPILFVCSALAVSSSHAEVLSDTDREALLGNLDKLRDSVESQLDARYRTAIAAYRTAIASDTAAMELYLNCMERVDFQEQQKKAGDFREWKRKQAEKLDDPGLRLALRHQLRWLMLTLQATADNADRTKLAADAEDIVDAIFKEPEKLAHQESLLSQPVTSSVFAKAYDIVAVKVEKWALSPIKLDQVYGDIILPPYRNPARLAQLRAAWIKRIRQEGAIAEFWQAKPREGGKEEKRIGMADAMRPPEFERFVAEKAPELQWEMEVDLFKNGDESGAAVRMIAHLEKYIAHGSVREWGQQLRALLKPAKPAGPDAAAPAP